MQPSLTSEESCEPTAGTRGDLLLLFTVLDGEAVCVLKGERDRGGTGVTRSGTGATGKRATGPGQQAADGRQDGRHSRVGRPNADRAEE